MTVLLTLLHALICLFLIIAILLQSSKGGGLAGMFGGGGMGQVFGGRGAASFLAKVTLWLGIGFAVTSVSIALLSTGRRSGPRSLVQQVMEQERTSSPAAMLPTAPGAEEIQQPEQAPVPQPEGERQ
jgi:preprotein translocase subunit SecG